MDSFLTTTDLAAMVVDLLAVILRMGMTAIGRLLVNFATANPALHHVLDADCSFAETARDRKETFARGVGLL